MKRNEGFTLVELLVSFTVGAIVALAATSVLLLGLRFNAISGGTAQRQNTTRILLTVFENLATEQQITKVDNDFDSWVINGSTGPLLSYSADEQIIYSGNEENKSILVEGIVASHVKLNGNLLSFYVETEDGSYSSSVYCRNNPQDTADSGETTDDKVDKLVANLQDPTNADPYAGLNQNLEQNQLEFLRTLVGELGSTGRIIGDANGTYYSEWYQSDWPKDTPWCACYISWALAQAQSSPQFKEANVDKLLTHFTINRYENPNFNPKPGDIIFFDWDGGEDPEHVGVVLYAYKQADDTAPVTYIYTIEGNSAGIVAVRKYQADDPRVIGYGSMTWN